MMPRLLARACTAGDSILQEEGAGELPDGSGKDTMAFCWETQQTGGVGSILGVDDKRDVTIAGAV